MMSHAVLVLGLTFTLVFGIAATASADAILVSDLRSVNLDVFATSNGDSANDADGAFPAADFLPLDALLSLHATKGTANAIGTASQNSVVTGTQFSGVGGITAGAVVAEPPPPDPDSGEEPAVESAGVHAESRYQVRFDLLEPHSYSLRGTLLRSVASVDPFNSAQAALLLVLASPSGPIPIITSVDTLTGSATAAAIDATGVLAAGTYSLLTAVLGSAAADTTAGTFDSGVAASYAFTLSLTPVSEPVPEPASFLLVGAALAAYRFRRFTAPTR